MRGSYYSGGRTNRGGRSKRGSTVCYAPDGLFWLNLYFESFYTILLLLTFNAAKFCKYGDFAFISNIKCNAFKDFYSDY